MICLSASETQRRFDALGLPNRFTDDELGKLETIDVVSPLPGLFGFPTPNDRLGLNILNLRKIVGVDPARQPAFFDHPWYLNEEFGSSDCEPGWHFIQMVPATESISQPIHYIRSLEPLGWELPSAIEVTLMLFLHYVGTGEQLLLKKHTWCRDQASMDRFVTVGAFGRNGLFVSGHPRDFASRGLGICAKLRPPLVYC